MSHRAAGRRLTACTAFLLTGLVLALASTASAQAPRVTDDTFTAEVIETSKQTPVFVNLYAIWCRPCRPLFPKLEAAAADHDGRAKLVSLDIDESPGATDAILGLLDRQGIKRPPSMKIPALVAFRDGKPTALIIGAHYEIEAVREFFDQNVVP